MMYYFVYFLILDGCYGGSGSSGEEFLITFLENEVLESFGPQPQCVTLTTLLEENMAVHVTSLYPDINFNTSVVINNTISEYICLDTSIQLKGTGISRKVVKVSAGNDISVMVHDVEIHSSDSYVAIPVEEYGTDYYITNYEHESLLSVAASENDTIVNIQFPIRTSDDFEFSYGGIDLLNPSDLQLTLQQYEVFQILMSQELTGAYVSSNRPVSVVSGNRKIKLYHDGSRDHLAEQMLPVDTWGTHFTSVPTPGKNGTDIYTILSSAGCSSIIVGNTTYLLEEEGSRVQINVSSSQPLQILSDTPIMVTKFITRTSVLDQCMMMIVPRSQWLNHYSFHFPQMSGKDGYLIVVVESRFRNSILINNNTFEIQQWIDVENTNLSVGYILLPNAFYTLYLPETDGNFAAYIQHSHKKCSYCTSIGKKIDKINKAWTHSKNGSPCTSQPASTTERFTEATSSSTGIFELFTTDPETTTITTVSVQDDPYVTEPKTSHSLSTAMPYYETNGNDSRITDKPCFSTNLRLLNLSVTDGEFLNIIEELKHHLKVVPQKTSQAIRKKISVPDYRPSSTTIGMSWWIVVALVFVLCILGNDLMRLLKDCRYGVRSSEC